MHRIRKFVKLYEFSRSKAVGGMIRSNCTCNETKWFPEKIILGNFNEDYGCMVLNRKIAVPPDKVKNLWENAKVRCTVDGGTNRWYNFIQKNCKGLKMKLPDYITGDFDSITEETSAFFNDSRIKRVHTPDQNDTDFTKALKVLKPAIADKNIHSIIVFHETSGRLDHLMANINTLFKANKIFCDLHLYLLGGNSMTWLLNPGKHSISIPSHLVENERWCSLIPIGEKSNVTTTGLRWNLNNHNLEFGGIVSTSNTYASTLININTTGHLLWSMGIFDFDDDDN